MLLILREFKWISYLLLPLKSSENHRFSNDFRGNRRSLICLNSHYIRSEIWRWSLTCMEISTCLKQSYLKIKELYVSANVTSFSCSLFYFSQNFSNSFWKPVSSKPMMHTESIIPESIFSFLLTYKVWLLIKYLFYCPLDVIMKNKSIIV